MIRAECLVNNPVMLRRAEHLPTYSRFLSTFEEEAVEHLSRLTYGRFLEEFSVGGKFVQSFVGEAQFLRVVESSERFVDETRLLRIIEAYRSFVDSFVSEAILLQITECFVDEAHLLRIAPIRAQFPLIDVRYLIILSDSTQECNIVMYLSSLFGLDFAKCISRKSFLCKYVFISAATLSSSFPCNYFLFISHDESFINKKSFCIIFESCINKKSFCTIIESCIKKEVCTIIEYQSVMRCCRYEGVFLWQIPFHFPEVDGGFLECMFYQRQPSSAIANNDILLAKLNFVIPNGVSHQENSLNDFEEKEFSNFPSFDECEFDKFSPESRQQCNLLVLVCFCLSVVVFLSAVLSRLVPLITFLFV